MQAPGSGFAIGAVIGRNTDKVWRIGQGRAGRRAGVGHSDVEPDVGPTNGNASRRRWRPPERSDGRYRRGRRANSTKQPEWRTCEQKTVAI